MSSNTIVPALDALNVDNVFIYVGDAVRWDTLSDRIA